MSAKMLTVTVYHSHRGGMFRHFDAETSTLAVAYTVTREADVADNDAAVLDEVWRLDNTGGAATDAPSYFDPQWTKEGWTNWWFKTDRVGRDYRQQRSLSVGDVVLVTTTDPGDTWRFPTETYQTYAVAPVGFTAIDYPVDAVVRGAHHGFDGMQACCTRDADLYRREEAEAHRAARGLYS